jgi:hypothetical protein
VICPPTSRSRGATHRWRRFGLLFTGGIVWILAIVWAYYNYSGPADPAAVADLRTEMEALRERLTALEAGQTETGGAS